MLRRAARVSPPRGLAVKAAVRAGNTRTDSAHNRYRSRPLELVKIEREARRQGLEIAGFYHSHPDHPAQWSATDFAEAHWLGCSYVITEVAHGKAAVTNSFLLSGTLKRTSAFSWRRFKSMTQRSIRVAADSRMKRRSGRG